MVSTEFRKFVQEHSRRLVDTPGNTSDQGGILQRRQAMRRQHEQARVAEREAEGAAAAAGDESATESNPLGLDFSRNQDQWTRLERMIEDRLLKLDDGSTVPLPQHITVPMEEDEHLQDLRKTYSLCADTSMSVKYSIIGTALAVPICIYMRQYMPLLILFTAGSAADLYTTSSACSGHKKRLDHYMMERRRADLLIQREVLRIAHRDLFKEHDGMAEDPSILEWKEQLSNMNHKKLE